MAVLTVATLQVSQVSTLGFSATNAAMSCRSAMAGVSALLGSVAPVSGEVSWVHNQRKRRVGALLRLRVRATPAGTRANDAAILLDITTER